MLTPRPAIDSRHLRYFVAVAENLSFTRASEQIYIAQPALTRQIKALELALNVRLFDRSSHHVALTAAGSVALQKAQHLLQELDDLVDATRHAAGGHAEPIRMGFGSHAAYQFVPQIVRAFRMHLPQFPIELHRFLADRQFDDVIDGKFDVALFRPLYEDPRACTRVIKRTRFMAALPAGHRLLEEQTVRMEDLANEDFVLPRSRPGPNFQSQVLGFCLDAGFQPKNITEASDVQVLVGNVASGYGVAVVAEPTAALLIPGVDYRPIEGLSATADYALAWRRDDVRPVMQRFIEVALSVGDALLPELKLDSNSVNFAHAPSGARLSPLVN